MKNYKKTYTDTQKQNSKQRNMIPFLLLTILLVIVLVTVVVFAVKGKESDGSNNTQNTDDTSANVEKWQEGVIKYNGKYYKYNNKIKNYLIMGIDKDAYVEVTDSSSGGQSDAMFLLVVNDADKTMSIVSINRNTMTDVDVYGDSGVILKTTEAQICTQHGFGDGKHLSCKRAADAVSRLFYNLPISGYLSMQMGAIPIMNDAIGGVELEVLQDVVYESKGVNLKAGETVTLTGDEAYAYLRARELDEFDSATDRLKRQEQYISCFVEQMEAYTSGSKIKALDIYEAISDYIVTNIDIASMVLQLEDYEYSEQKYSVPGETRMGEVFEEYHVDDDALYDMIIELFYVEV